MNELALLAGAMEEFALDCSRFPSEEEGLTALLEMPADMTEGVWDGPYVKEKQLNDPWERPYLYLAEGVLNQSSFDLYSLGPDGQDGTEDDIYND